MIRLDVQDYCHSCPEFEASVVMIDHITKIDTIIHCEHQFKCDRIKQYLKEKSEND
jgi:hypothetical protein